MEIQQTRVTQYREQTQLNDLKQHADKIIQGIKKIGPSHVKRAIWELFQNAVDLSPNCEISISITDEEFIFSHNGIPFTMHTLDCLFTQVSSKTLSEKKLERVEVDPIGQYGTGFMTSHSFGDVVKVSGAIKDEFEEENSQVNVEGHIKFENLIIDRSSQDWKKLCREISNLRDKVIKLLSQTLTYDELPFTNFKFKLKTELNYKRAQDSIDSLKTILPYVMVFNDRLKKVSITDINGNTAIYQKDDKEQYTSHYFSRDIHINDETRKIIYLKTDRLIIILPLEIISGEKNYSEKAYLLTNSLPRLFLFYPLIGTEAFGFNFLIHSKNFQPTEPRDGLHLNSENEKNKIEEEANQNLMEEASILIFNFLENNLSRIQNPHLLAEINFPLSSDDIELNQYFITLKDKWTTKFRALPFVETLTNRIATQNAVFLNSVVIVETEPETLKAIYNIASKFYPNLPKPELIPIWTKLTDEWGIKNIVLIGFAELAEKIQQEAKIEFFNKTELIFLYKEMIRKGEGELFTNKALIPNIKGQFKKQAELSMSVDLSDDLLEIADVINPKISNRQIDSDFLLDGLEFEPFARQNYMELINTSINEHIKEGTRSQELPENYLASLMRYASIVSREDSTSAPVRVIKLIAEHYNLPLNQIVLPTLQGKYNIDIRKGQYDLFNVFLNDISDKDKDWVRSNIDSLAKILSEAFSNADIKKFFLKYDVYPNQIFGLRSITSLHKDFRIPEFVKDLYDKVIEPSELVRTKLAHTLIEKIYEEMKPINSLDLTRQIEQQFFGDSGSDINMENNSFKPDIIDIIRNFKENQPLWETYKEIFPATFRNKSTILVQLADGEDSFSILSQDKAVIKKLAGIASHSNLDELIKLGEEAIRKKLQGEMLMQYKKKIGNHLEHVLRKHLSQNIIANVSSEQDGQDLILYFENQPIYFIEVKSKWLETTPIRISRNQTLRAHENQNCYALCSIDMTKYIGTDKNAVNSIETIADYMKFNTDIGKKVEHLVSIYANAHQEDKFSLDGDYRTLIPSIYIKEEGLDLKEFEASLLEYINNNC